MCRLRPLPLLLFLLLLSSSLPAAERPTGSGSWGKAAKNPDVTVRRMPGLNHLFQHAKTGAVSEYATIPETMAPELEIVTQWIRERFLKPAAR